MVTGISMQQRQDNKDLEEIHKFDELADDWWDPTGSLATLHVINPVRLAYISSNTVLAGKRILDVGCGGGLLSESLAKRGAAVTGIDASEAAVSAARRHARPAGLAIDYQQITAEAFAENEPVGFDVITCMELLEHVPDPASLLAACARMLKPGGDLFLATLNRNARSYLSAVLAAEYLLGLLPRGTHDYAKFLRPSEIAAMLRAVDMDVMDISGMHYLPGVNRCFVNNDPSVNYLMHARLPCH